LWLVVDTVDGNKRELAVTVDPTRSIDHLGSVLSQQLGRGAGADDRWLYNHRLESFHDPASPIGASSLRFGDHLTLAHRSWSPPGSERRRTGSTHYSLVVIGGPGTGARFPLANGAHVLGRGQNADITVDDPALSRHHLRLTIADIGITIADEQSSNGTFIDGKSIDQPTPVAVGTVVQAGHSLLRIDPYEAAASSAQTGADGLVRFNRPPRYATKATNRSFVLEAPPRHAERRRLPMTTALGSLVVGIPMLIVALTMSGSGRTMFIAMSAISLLSAPVLAAMSYLEDRRSGATQYRQDAAKFRARVEELSDDLVQSLREEEAERRRAVPDAVDLVERAIRLRSNLWERRPADPDFLECAVGFADQPSTATVEFLSGGHDALREEAEQRLSAHELAHNVPLVSNLRAAGVAGVCGDPEAVTALTSWIVTQLAVLHSPRDLVIAAAVPNDELGWLRWLPHVRSVLTDDQESGGADWLAIGERASLDLIERLTGIVRRREAASRDRQRDALLEGPFVVAFLSEQVRVPRTTLAALLERGAASGVYVVWLGSDADSLPGEAGEVITATRMPATVTLSRPASNELIGPGLLDQLDSATARRVVRALAPVIDVTAGGAHSQIPSKVTLPELLGMGEPSAEQIAARWQRHQFGIDAPVGRTANDIFTIDLRGDGPHALVGGTTGAGKSELLQTFIAALAATHPPNHLTFLLIDYKGGAAFKDAIELPHTVGFVTDLDGHLVHRALVSLNAELRRREHILRDHDAKDILEMERRHPHAAPPALVLIVDEFAALAKELPEFVDGVVNIAQRGRSLGIHLILATQRPAGAINDNIRANTNLRIALRMNDAADSDDVINARDAALLPRTLPGRAFVRRGQSDLTEVQIAYVGGHSLQQDTTTDLPTVAVDLVHSSDARERGKADPPAAAAPTPNDVDQPSDLQMLVGLIRDANELASIEPPPAPWMPDLPHVLTFDALLAPTAGAIALGLVDVPAEQAQRTWSLDVESDGSLLVFGATGSGKTTVLRSAVAAVARSNSIGLVHVYGIDAAGRGLAPLERLPQVGAIIALDDIERVQRLITHLERERTQRHERFAAAGVSTLTEYRSVSSEPIARIVVLLDGYGPFSEQFDRFDNGTWLDRVGRLIADGRAVGIHWIVTADRRGAVPSSLMSAMAAKLVLRMTDPDDYPSLGLDARTTRGATLPPGRGFTGESLEVQIAVMSADPSGPGQSAALEALGTQLASADIAPRIVNMPAEVAIGDLPTATTPFTAVLGVRQSDLAPATISLDDGNFFIAGPNRSGKSTALATVLAGLRQTTPNLVTVLFAPRRTPLESLGGWSQVARGHHACDALALELASRLDDDGSSPTPVLMVIDDASELADTEADDLLDKVVRRGQDHHIHCIAAAESLLARRAYGGIVSSIRRDRHGLLLTPDPDLDGDLLNTDVPRRQPSFWVPGRGVFVTRNAVNVVQVAR
jgi:S-DNA-T family DNA segregation ATPase FtsK/SpoIIIE